MVVLFHYTNRFQELFPGERTPVVSVHWAGFGVTLFFVLSGYVILMSIERSRRPTDFVVSRLSRIFPTYWLAVVATFATVEVLGLPGQRVTAGQAVVNLSMLQGFLRVPSVDGVYWTLEIELCFYLLMVIMFAVGFLRGRRVMAFLVGWLVVSQIAVDLAGPLHSRSFSTVVSVAGLRYSHLFVAGMCIYSIRARRDPARFYWTVLAATPLFDLWRGGAESALFVVGWILLLLAATTQRGRAVSSRPLVFAGYISYPLYLIHQNVGYALLRRLHGSPTLDTLIVIVVMVAAATAVSYLVEHPATRYLRARYRQHRSRRRPAPHAAVPAPA
jgi:peptidoglycan/LPS O-acetylase OafA/YrhL